MLKTNNIKPNGKRFFILAILISISILITLIYGIYGFKPIGNNSQSNNNGIQIDKKSFPTEIWNSSYVTDGIDRGYDIIVDGNYVYLVGDTYAPSLDYNIVLLKYNMSGSQIWNITWNTSDFDFGKGIAIDSTHNIYVAGYTQGSGEEDFLLIKFNSDGNQLWNKTYNISAENEKCYDIKIDGNDNIYLFGEIDNNSRGLTDAYLLKLNTDGIPIWNKSLYFNNNNNNGRRIAIQGNYIYITGIGMELIYSSYDVFIAKLDFNKNIIWNRSWGGTASDTSNGITMDGSNNIYITGASSSFSSSQDAIILKYDLSGNKLWNKTFGGAKSDSGKDIVCDVYNNIYLAGQSEDLDAKISFNDPFLAKFDSNGNHNWNITWKEFSNGYMNAITLDSNLNLYAVSNINDGSGVDIYLHKIKVGSVETTTTPPIPSFEITWLLVSICLLFGFIYIKFNNRLIIEMD